MRGMPKRARVRPLLAASAAIRLPLLIDRTRPWGTGRRRKGEGRGIKKGETERREKGVQCR